jgi:hypothetical protein
LPCRKSAPTVQLSTQFTLKYRYAETIAPLR